MIKLPSNWNEVTIGQYYELLETETIEWDSSIEKIIEQLAILLDTSSDDDIIANLEVDEIFTIFNDLKWIKNEIPTSIANEFEGMKLKPWGELTLGEFIDIENLFSVDPNNNIHILASIIYRHFKPNEWNIIKLEPYDYDITSRYELFKNMPITRGMGLLKSYLAFRESFLNSYENLFQSPDSVEEDNELEGEELIQHTKEVIKQKMLSKWSWESTLYDLSGDGDITKFHDLFNTSLILAFNILSYKKIITNGK